MNRNLVKNILKIIADISLILVLLVAVFVVFITITSKKDADGASEILGYQMRFIQSDSMEKSEYTDVNDYEIKEIPIKTLVFIKLKPDDKEELNKWYETLEIGDVLTFKYLYNRQETITHRITNIEKKDTGGYIISLAGDNKDTSNGDILTQVIDTSIDNSPNYIIGKVTRTSYLLGNLVYLIKQPIGIICLVIIPCLIIMVLEIIRIINIINLEKKNKMNESLKELDELKKKLQELENNKSTSAEC